MDERVVQFKIGVMVLAILIITLNIVILMWYFGEGANFFKHKETIHIKFDEAPGVVKKTPICVSGIAIGRVTDVELMKDGSGVMVTATIDADKDFVEGKQAWLSHSLLTNEAVIEFRRANNGNSDYKDESRPATDSGGRPLDAPPAADHATATGSRVAPIAELPALPAEMPIILTAFQITETQAAPAPTKLPAPGKPVDEGRPDHTFQGHVEPGVINAVDRFSQLDFKKAIDSLTNASTEVQKFMVRANIVLGNVGHDMDDLSDMAKDVRQFIKDPRLNGTLANMNDTFKKMDDAMNKFTEDRDETGATTVEHVNRAARRIDELTRQVAEQKDDEGLTTVDQFRRAAKGMGDLTPLLAKFTGNLYQDMYEEKDEKGLNTIEHFRRAAIGMDDMVNNQSGSLFKMVHNPDLYDNLNNAAGNIKELTVQLQPVIHDARVFSDKIARHPETLGVRGAISPSLGTKGLPSLPPLGGSSGWSDDPSQTPPPNGQPWRYNR